jgi:archaemetzincin
MKLCVLPVLLLLSSCASETDPLMVKTRDYFEAIESNDIALHAPVEGEWLYHHHEKGQSFEAYKKASPPRPTDSGYIMYLKPIGHFTALQDSVLELTRAYVEVFFQQKTVLLPASSDEGIPDAHRRMPQEGFEQLSAPYVLDSMLKGKIPTNGIALMAITEKDLYPRPDWNFVFGLASYEERVGVSSIYRLQDESLDTGNFKKCLARLIKISSHEIGHMFSLHHCTNAKCVMNGSNHLGETDATPARPCSECQKKLLWNFRYDNRKRLGELVEFFRANGLDDDLVRCEQDLSAF